MASVFIQSLGKHVCYLQQAEAQLLIFCEYLPWGSEKFLVVCDVFCHECLKLLLKVVRDFRLALSEYTRYRTLFALQYAFAFFSNLDLPDNLLLGDRFHHALHLLFYELDEFST